MNKYTDNCSNCYFQKEGYCRRYPPQVLLKKVEVDLSANLNSIYDDLPYAYFPEVNSSDWCGEHKPGDGSERNS